MDDTELADMVAKKAQDIVKQEIEAEKKKKPDQDSFTVDEFVKHQDNCNDPDCPACVGIRKTEVAGKISNLKQQVSNIEKARQEQTAQGTKEE